MVVTDIQKEWLRGYVEGKRTKRDNPHKHSVYMNRIRKRVSHQLENLLWLANNMPEVLRDEEWEIQELGHIAHRRIKILFQVMKGLYPETDPVLMRIKEEITPSYD